MKKNIFKSLLCLSAAMMFVACEDTMDDKADIDAGHVVKVTAMPTIASAPAVTFSAADVAVTLSDLVGIVEVSVELSTTEDFAESTFKSAATIESVCTIAFSGLAEQTTYYVRPYIYTVNGTTIVGEVTNFTTEAAPVFTIDGLYTAQEYNLDFSSYEFAKGASYQILIEFKDGSATEVVVTNLWNGGLEITGMYDEATQTVTIPSGQVLYNQAGVYDFVASGLDNSLSPLPAFTLSFTPLGGELSSSLIDVSVDGFGTQDIFFVDMKHD